MVVRRKNATYLALTDVSIRKVLLLKICFQLSQKFCCVILNVIFILIHIIVQVEANYHNSLNKLIEAVKTNYNDRFEIWKNWGGGILSSKSNAKFAKVERARTREVRSVWIKWWRESRLLMAFNWSDHCTLHIFGFRIPCGKRTNCSVNGNA